MFNKNCGDATGLRVEGVKQKTRITLSTGEEKAEEKGIYHNEPPMCATRGGNM